MRLLIKWARIGTKWALMGTKWANGNSWELNGCYSGLIRHEMNPVKNQSSKIESYIGILGAFILVSLRNMTIFEVLPMGALLGTKFITD